MTIFGWDASHYDSVPDGARVVAEGFAFMTHKAGGDAQDPELHSWWDAVRGQRDKLLLGAYSVLRPDLSGSAVRKADAFLAQLDSQCPGWRDGPFILQVDCEAWNGNIKTQPGKAYIDTFCDRLKARMPKLTPIVYASAGQYGDTLTGLTYPLWNARYPISKTGAASAIYQQAGGDTGKGWARYSGQVPEIWQFTSSATIAGQTTCDANAYRGTRQQLTDLIAPGWAKQPVEEIDVELTDKYGDPAYASRTVANRLKDDASLRDLLCEAPIGAGYKLALTAIPAGSMIRQLAALPAAVADIEAKLDTFVAPTVEITDEQLTRCFIAALKQLAAGQ